jgi:glucose-1-phosphate thymidylyltransferase
MKGIILCAGYATRLYPLTLKTPKPLLEIKGKPLLNYLLDNVFNVPCIDEVFIVTNNKFYDNFVEWKEKFYNNEKIVIVNDETKSNEDRLGGLGDLKLVLNTEEIDDDLILLLGDNLFDFDLNKIVNFFKEKNKNVIGLYDIKDISNAKNFGVLKIDDEKKIVSFNEKPQNPDSTLISTGIYIYSKDELKKIDDYMKTNKPKEGPGYLIPYFLESQDVYGFVIDGKWYDIGSKEVYEEVNLS